MVYTSTKKVSIMKYRGEKYIHLRHCKLSNGTKSSQHCFKNLIQVDGMSKVARLWIDQYP